MVKSKFMNEKSINIEIISPGNDIYTDLDRRLVEWNSEQVDWSTQIFQVVLKCDRNFVVGGARGVVRMGTVEMRGLWVDPELRGSGAGKMVVNKLEHAAKSIGASHVLLDTYDFQAREFYKKLGYCIFGTYQYPNGTYRYYMWREL